MGSSSILGVGQSALIAAQTGLVTTGHNIANVNTPGYSRQTMVQGAAAGQDIGVGFIGKGTDVVTVRRVFDQFLHDQVVSTQVSKNSLDAYYAQIKQIDNMLADPTAGVSAAMQDFFESVQAVASDAKSSAARQSMLSASQAMAARFQTVGDRLDELRQGVNGQITNSIGLINNYSQQIADLNDAIEKAQGTSGQTKPANDLLDQRDQVIADLSKETKVTIVKQGNSYNVFIGNGQALTVGTTTYKLSPIQSSSDPTKLQVGYTSNGVTKALTDSSLPGGRLGGLLEFRNDTLYSAQNALGRVAIGMAASFNEQHRLGQAQDGTLGGDYFTVGSVQVNPNNATGQAGKVQATVTDASKLTTSDYRLQYSGATQTYTITRLSDNATVYPVGTDIATDFPSRPDAIEGLTLTAVPPITPGVDADFLIKPTANGAMEFGVALKDITKIAAAAPVRTEVGAGNSGTGKISAAAISSTVLPAATLTFDSATGTFTGFPAGLDVRVTGADGNVTPYPAVTAATPVAYQSGDTIEYGGVSFTITGAPADGDTFIVAANTNGVGDNRNALRLADLQTANTLANGTMSLSGAYTHMVSTVGNKTRELQVTSAAEGKRLEYAMEAHQSTSGVNLDEEAANMMRYQQAYQAAAKVMQIASDLFDTLLSMGIG